MTEKVGEMFKEDGSVGRQFTPEGAAGADPYSRLTPPTSVQLPAAHIESIVTPPDIFSGLCSCCCQMGCNSCV